MKSLVTLHTTILADYGQLLSTDVTRDALYIERRTEEEGDSFLTITLPSFAKALERGLELGKWPITDSSSFRRIRGLPAFLRGFLTGIFDGDGHILPSPDAVKIQAVRQICLTTQKIERDCSPARVEAALNQYVETDQELMYLPARMSQGDLDLFDEVTQFYFGSVFRKADLQIANYDLIPKHGPGAVADKISHKERWQFPYWPERLEDVFPRWRYQANLPTEVDWTSPLVPMSDESPVRIVTVPKTQSTPRIIAIEPSAMQYAQQGLKKMLYEEIARGPLSKVLGFQDQTRNQELARKGSIDGSLATLDLSEASDRVHWWFVQRMVRKYPHLRDFLSATRSSRAELPTGEVVPLQKYASMGSATTFPIEAIFFTSIALMGMWRRGYQRARVRALHGRFSVYGDDIIVPVHTVESVVETLEAFGLKVNRRKSFWNGKFRESCGAEFFSGDDVSIHRLRREIPRSLRDAREVASFVSFRNNLYEAGLWGTVRLLDKVLDRIIPAVPSNSVDAPALVRLTRLPLCGGKARFNESLHRQEVRAPVLIAHTEEYEVEGYQGLYRWFTQAESPPVVDRHSPSERPSAYSIYTRWVSRDFLVT